MLESFKPYYNTVRNYLKIKNNKAYKLFNEKRLFENLDNHDNWNGGIDYYTIILKIPVNLFVEIEGEEEKNISEEITKAFLNATREDESLVLNGTVIVPYDEEESYFPTSDSIWNLDYFRLFISHVSENKASANNLKICLEELGIHGFVAHEDIEPSQEWINVLNDALFTMNALCAILVKKFRYSNWCDQEVGFALGQNKLCIPINKEIIPYGFLGKYQMIKAHGKDAREIAKKISECIYKDQRTHGIYCNCLAKLLINSKTEEKAITWINIIKEFKTIEKIYIEIIWKEYGKNPICLKPNILDKLNLLFKDYGFPTKFSNFSYTEMETEDLPF